MSQLKKFIYQTIQCVVPYRVKQFLERLSTTQVVRDRFFRPGGVIEIIDGKIEWEDLNFYFAAPYQIFIQAQKKGVENRICRLARSILQDGDTAIDVGANYGFITAIMGKCIFPSGCVVSIEIDPAICRVIKQTTEKNGLSEQTIIIPKGAGSKKSDKFETIDEILEDQKLKKVTFIKIDVDGEELDVILGARNTMRLYHPVMVVEMNKNKYDIYKLLIDIGYSYFIDQSNNEVIPGNWPLNLIASAYRISIPEKGAIKIKNSIILK
jgi:hypothetical protein